MVTVKQEDSCCSGWILADPHERSMFRRRFGFCIYKDVAGNTVICDEVTRQCPERAFDPAVSDKFMHPIALVEFMGSVKGDFDFLDFEC
jgi:hypothetical protein